MRASILNNERPEAQELKNRFYGEDQADDQPVFEEIDNVETSLHNSNLKLKKPSLIGAIGDVLNTS